MAFSGGAFQGPFRRPFGGGAAAVTGWWLSGGIAAANCLAAYTPKGAASLAASYDNNAAPGNGLPDGTYDATPGVAPTWAAATGWTFDGATQYLRTNLVPTNDGTWSAMVRFTNATRYVGENAFFGTEGNAAARYFYVSASTGAGLRYANGIAAIKWVTPTAAVVGFAGSDAYRNGVNEGLTLGSAVGAIVYQIYVGAYNYLNNPIFYNPCTIVALAVWNVTLTAPQVVAVSAAMAAL